MSGPQQVRTTVRPELAASRTSSVLRSPEVETLAPDARHLHHPSAGVAGRYAEVPPHAPVPAARLRVSAPSDPAEHQAEAVAERVVRGLPAFGSAPAAPLSVVGRVADDEAPEEDTEGATMLEEDPSVEVQASRPGGPATAPLGFGAAVTAGRGGVPLPDATHATMARSFGRSFADVRLHHDQHADRLARSIGARAFTWGSHVYLSSSARPLEDPAGIRLLAHELAHVVQHSSTSGTRTLHRSPAFYMSTQGKQGYYEAAKRFHRDRGFPAPVEVASVEEMLEDLVGRTGVSSIRLVTHAVPAGIFLTLLRRGTTTLFEQDLGLQGQGALESELATEHPTVGGQVHTLEHHVLPRQWATDVYTQLGRSRAFTQLRTAHGLPTALASGGDLETYLWWLADREVLTAQRPTGPRGRLAPVVAIPNRRRASAVASLDRNVAYYRSLMVLHLVARSDPRSGTPADRRARAEAAAASLEQQAAAAAGQLIIAANNGPGLQVQVAVPSPRYGSIQGALERGTYSNNLLKAKVMLPHQIPFEIRGCRIGQNMGWLEKFRDFWGLGVGAPPGGRRPDVSAPDLRHIYGIETVTRGRRVVDRRSAEWLEGPRRRRIRSGTAEFDQHIVHAR
jgi:hypothetical protein